MDKSLIPVHENIYLKPGVKLLADRRSGKQRYMIQMEWEENRSSVPVSFAASL